jgi:hypothetical protein
MMVERDLDHSSIELLHGGVVLAAHRFPVTLLVGPLARAFSFIKEHLIHLQRNPLYYSGAQDQHSEELLLRSSTKEPTANS